MYYTYVDWTVEPTPRPFYVGKGTLERVQLVARRNPRHTAIRKAYGFRREVVFSSENEVDALEREKQLIIELNTRDDHGGWGANFTEGGSGVKGRNHDEQTKRRISETTRGRKKSVKVRANMSHAQSKKPIVQYDFEGNVVATFRSQLEACRVTGVAQQSIGKCCLRKLKSAGGFVWRFVGDRFDPKTPAVLSHEHRAKLSQSHMGMKLSEETRKKIGTGLRQYHKVVNNGR